MPLIFSRLPGSFLGTLYFIIALGALAPANVCAHESLPTTIPTKDASLAELIDESAEAAGQIKGAKQRIAVLAAAFYRLREMSREELRPLLAVLAREAQKEECLVPIAEHAESIHAAPEIAFEAVMKLSDEKVRTQGLWYIVRNAAAANPELARRVIRELKGTLRYSDALVAFADQGPRDIDEAKAVLTELKSVGVSDYQSPIRFVFASALGRFVSTHFSDVVEFVRSTLPPGEANLTLCRLASNCYYQRKEEETGNRLLDAVAERILSRRPTAVEVEMLLQHGFARRDLARASALFDEYLLPQLEERKNVQACAASISLLAEGSLPVALNKARAVAERIQASPNQLMADVICRQEPATALQWLRQTPASPVRDLAVGTIARALQGYATNQRLKGQAIQPWIKELSEFALKIGDGSVRWRACDGIHNLADWHQAVAPASIEEERAKLYPLVEAGLLPFQQSWYIALWPPSRQRAEIEKAGLTAGTDSSETVISAIGSAAKLIGDSSLPLEEKRERMQMLLQNARKIPIASQRASALSEIGVALGAIDYAQSLHVLREEQSLAREFGLRREPQDAIDVYEAVYPPGVSPGRFKGDLHEVAEALWTFAHELQNADDREIVLASLAAVLAHQQKFSAAAGVATLIESPARKSQALSRIAGVQSGKLRDD